MNISTTFVGKKFKSRYDPINYYNDQDPQVSDQYKKYNIQAGEIDPENDEYIEEEELDDDDQLPTSASAMKKKKLIRKARKLDPNNPQDFDRLQRRKERIKQLHNTTRWLPNTAFSTYFGKPAWGPYGFGNVKPSVGGIFYGQHMYSHNVQPHRFINEPHHQQSYNNALRFSSKNPEVVPELPRKCNEEFRLNPEQVEELRQRNPLTLQPFNEAQKNITDSRGKMQVPARLGIKKPDLINSMRFASEEGSVLEEVLVAATDTKKKNPQVPPEQPKKENQQPQAATPQQQTIPKKQASKRPSSAAPGVKNQKEVSDKPQDKKTKQKKEEKKLTFQKKAENIPKSDQKAKEQAFEDDGLQIPDKSNKKFIDEMRRKKEKSQRLAPKINQINPNLYQQKPEIMQAPTVISKDLEDIKQIDPMNPPLLYLSQLDPSELNPKCYKHIPPEWLQRIPYAGKRKEKIGDAKECFDFGY